MRFAKFAYPLINSSKAMYPIVPLSWEARRAKKPQLPLESTSFRLLVPCAMNAHRLHPGPCAPAPGPRGFPSFASPIEIYSCKALLFIS